MDYEDLKRFIEYIERTRAERSGSKEKARQCLYEEGIIDKDGNLTPEYGGETVSVGHVERTRAERDAFARLIAHHTATITKTKETARTALIGEGIYDQDGNLTPEYGGPGNSTPPKQKGED